MRWRHVLRRLGYVSVAAGTGGVVMLWALPKAMSLFHKEPLGNSVLAADMRTQVRSSPLPSREDHLRNLQETEYDIVVIGGGATGCGVALDAQSRADQLTILDGQFRSSSGQQQEGKTEIATLQRAAPI